MKNHKNFTPQLSGSIIIPAGTNQVTANILGVLQTNNFSGTKFLTITVVSNNYFLNTSNLAASMAIEPGAPVVSVAATYQYASPNNACIGQFSITRDGGLSNSCTVNLTYNGTATVGSDYTALPSSVQLVPNQTTTNLNVYAINSNLLTAETVVLSLGSGAYFPGLTTIATVTLLPNSSTTNSVTSPVGRYWRGSGSDPTYLSTVVPLDSETGTVYSNLNGNCSALYSNLTSWNSQTLYHYNATNPPQTNVANRIPFNNPIVGFGERVGGTPLYFSQPYDFGIYAGNVALSNQPVVIQAFYRNTVTITTNFTVITNFAWTASTMPQYDWDAVAYGNGTFVAISDGASNAAYSADGINWTLSTLPSSDDWNAITYGDNKFVAISADSSSAAYSANGINWTACTLPIPNVWQAVTYGNNTFVAIADIDPRELGVNHTNVAYSSNGINWLTSMLPFPVIGASIAYGNGVFVALGPSTNGAYSTDGINWTLSTMPLGTWSSVAYGNGIFSAITFDETNAAYSTDGINWTVSAPLPYAADWIDVTYGNGIFAAVTLGTNAAYSLNGTNWISSAVPSALPFSFNWNCVTFGNSTFVAVLGGTNAAYASLYTTNYSYVTNFASYQLAGSVSIYPPTLSNSNAWTMYTTNGFQITTNGYGLTTTLSGAANLGWGEASAGAYVLTHTASLQASNYYYVVSVSGNPDHLSDPMAVNGSGQIAPSMLYSLEFESRPPWRAVFRGRVRVSGGEQRSSLSIASSGCEDQVSLEVTPVAHFPREPSSG